MSRLLIVTRHQGAIPVIRELIEKEGFEYDESLLVEHFTIELLESGDIVVGVLPTFLMQELTSRGYRFFAFDLRIPQELRGEDLSEEQVRELEYSMTEYLVFNRSNFNLLLQQIGEMFRHEAPYPDVFPFE